MTYIITTLAVGDEYINTALSLYYDLLKKTKYADYNITTNIKKNSKENINIDFFYLDRYHNGEEKTSFYYNLKSLALKYAVNKEYDYIVYLDADYEVTDNFNEQGLLNLFDYMEKNNYDAIFERPLEIGENKLAKENILFKKKLEDYNVFDHNKWDKAHIVNEQFMVFKNSWKYKYFCRRWEEMTWYSIANSIINFPEGFEVGVSAIEAEMSFEFSNWRSILRDYFKFKDKNGNTHYRF